MKWFRHDLGSRDSDQVWELMDTHGLQGYGLWWVVLEECYSREPEGFQVSASETWLKRMSRQLGLTDWRTMIRVLDTMAELGLIDPQLWAENLISVPGIAKRGDSYIVKRAQEREKKRRYREKKLLLSTVDSEGTKGQTPVLSLSDPDPDPDPDPEIREKTTERAQKNISATSNFPPVVRRSSAQICEDRFTSSEKPSPWVKPEGGYVDPFVVLLASTRFSKCEEAERRMKAVDAIRWVESGRASRADKDAMLEVWRCYQESLKAQLAKAESEVVRLIDYGSTAESPFWSTTHGEVVDMKLSKWLSSGRAKALKITGVSQSSELYRIRFEADGEAFQEVIKKNSIVPKEVIAS